MCYSSIYHPLSSRGPFRTLVPSGHWRYSLPGSGFKSDNEKLFKDIHEQELTPE
jgi:hypothetical protein